jgi:hypothetical protein
VYLRRHRRGVEPQRCQLQSDRQSIAPQASCARTKCGAYVGHPTFVWSTLVAYPTILSQSHTG